MEVMLGPGVHRGEGGRGLQMGKKRLHVGAFSWAAPEQSPRLPWMSPQHQQTWSSRGHRGGTGQPWGQITPRKALPTVQSDYWPEPREACRCPACLWSSWV